MKYDGHDFFSSEQLFMYLKAKLFNDEESMEKILAASTSKDAKELGRLVKGFDQEVWDSEKENLMLEALRCKSKYSSEFKSVLLENKDKIFVECNPYDNIWSCGLSENDPRGAEPEKWRGQNLLGKCMNRLIEELINE